MTIYKVTASVYDYWDSEDRGGWITEEKYFTTLEKAERWKEENKNKMYGFEGVTEAEDDYFKPSIRIDEITVE